MAVVASLVAAAVATLGLIVVSVNDRWAGKNRVHFASFASGILLTTAILLMPEAFGAHARAPFMVLAGYIFLYSVNALFRPGAGRFIAPFLAISIHSFIDGFEYTVLFQHDVYVGWIASIGLIAHEFAEAVILYAVLRSAGAGAITAWIGGFIGAAVTTPIGAVASGYALQSISPADFGLLLAAAAGALLYVGATHLPAVFSHGKKTRVPIFYLIGVAVAVGLSFGHRHDHAGGHHGHESSQHHEASHGHDNERHHHDEDPSHSSHEHHDHE